MTVGNWRAELLLQTITLDTNTKPKTIFLSSIPKLTTEADRIRSRLQVLWYLT